MGECQEASKSNAGVYCEAESDERNARERIRDIKADPRARVRRYFEQIADATQERSHVGRV